MVNYTTRETVARALDAMESAYAYDQIDRAIEAASRIVEGPDVCNRRFYPEVGTFTFDWPPHDQPTDGHTLWLDDVELVSVTTLTNGDGSVISSADYHLEPRTGPPFDSIEIDLAGSESWESGDTWQRAITVAGVRGYQLTQRPAGTLAAAVASTSATSITVTNGHAIGVGDLLTIGTERLEVTGRALVDTTETITANLDGEHSSVTVPVDDGAAFTAGEEITVDSETMLIRTISGNDLTVRRAHAGSVLAAHTSGAAVYASRTLTVTRGALGTTAATHLIGAAVTAQVYPHPVVTAVVAQAIAQVLQEQAGYVRTVGSGESLRQASGRGVTDTLKAARAAVGRKGRLF